jgi:serine/threonine-protein kinase
LLSIEPMPHEDSIGSVYDSHGDHTPPAHLPLARATGPVPAIGTVLADRYEVLEVLGRGGMSTVLGAFDRELERPVAVKVLHGASTTTALRDEARTLAAAQSPHVVALFALHLDESPPFLVMERVYGTSLDHVLRASPPSWSDAMALLARIARALDVLHDHGLVHGDVKPANVLLTREGDVKLADMGIAPLLRQSQAGSAYGTPSCMPPERARGLAVPESLLARGDVYSFAVLAYTILAGRAPFPSTSAHELIRLHASMAPPALSSVCALPASLDGPCARALAKSPHERHARAGELMREIERATRGLGNDGAPLSVLVVDDDADTRTLFHTVLGMELPGAALSSAASGDDALARLAVETPSVVLLDLAMPGLNGIPLLAHVAETVPAPRIVVVTGLGSGRERAAAARLGVRHFLVKPVAPDELVRCVLDSVKPGSEGWPAAGG